MKTTDPVSTREGSDLERVYRREASKLWRSLLLATGNREIASDAVAEAFAQALRRGSALREPERWLWRTAFRLAAAEMKRWREMAEVPDWIATVDESLVDVIEALRRLTPHQRTAVILADYAGYSHRHIAHILGSTTSAVAVHVHRGRRRLRVLLEVHDD